ncbi:SIMPL domain-containing protein [Spongiibacter tropicus]|uniref:SIMPL domain-containing protein n=1 Tax=Spongiibacter tropicus TaxID=454602 RepID=UPI003A9921A0
MQQNSNRAGLIFLGLCLLLGLSALGYLLGNAALQVKSFERSVNVKGLAEREYPADVVIWPIQFSVASNQLADLYAALEQQSGEIREFLTSNGVDESEITQGAPAITDKSAQQYGGNMRAEFRYTATQAVTVYSENIPEIRQLMSKLSQLGKRGIVLEGGYQAQAEYLFTRLNDIKPAMIEEATTKAREVAQKFARDSESRLGKIKRASQGQFSIRDRDRNNPHIKMVRVVSTVEYYLSD